MILLLISLTIKEVKTLDSNGRSIYEGERVTVTGVVTTTTEFGGYGPAFIQDSEAGIALYGAGVSSLTRGDTVEVTGVVETYNGLIEIKDFEFTVKGTGPPPSPLKKTSLDINEENEGMLITIEGVEFLSTGSFETGTITARDSLSTFTVYIDRSTDIPGKDIPQDKTDITGIVSQYDTSLPYTSGYQLMPRTYSDITEQTQHVDLIKELYMDSDGDGIPDVEGETKTVEGIVTGVFSNSYIDFFVQDSSRWGINIYDGFKNMDIREGDSVRVTGEVKTYKGKLELTSPSIEVISRDNPLPSPVEITVSVLNSTEYEGGLVKINNVSIEGDIFSSNESFVIIDSTGTGFIWIDRDTDIGGGIVPQGFTSITGIKSQYDETEPYTSGFQLLPRKREDIEGIGDVPLYTIREVQKPGDDGYTSSMVDRFVRVQGVVTMPSSVFNPGKVSFFIQDSTGGINIYNCSGDSDYGDSMYAFVEVTGKVEEYAGLTEIKDGYVKFLSMSQEIRPETLETSLNESLEGFYVYTEGIVLSEPVKSGSGYEFEIGKKDMVFTVRIPEGALFSHSGVKKGMYCRVRGVVTQYDLSSPFSTGYSIAIRDSTDIEIEGGKTGEPGNVNIEITGKTPFSPYKGEVCEVLITIPAATTGNLSLYDTRGRKVWWSGDYPEGEWKVFIEGKDMKGTNLLPGFYILQIELSNGEKERRVICVAP